MTEVEITLPWPAEALQSNSRKGRWGKARSTKKARGDAMIMALSSRVCHWPNAVIRIEYYPPSRRGDPQNVPAALKAYIDGIADAMGCDDRKFRVQYPDQFAGTRKPGDVVFYVSEGETEKTGD